MFNNPNIDIIAYKHLYMTTGNIIETQSNRCLKIEIGYNLEELKELTLNF